MPVWLITFLTKLIQPIVESIIDRMLIAARISAIEKKQDEMKAAFDKAASAKTVEEYREAVRSISSAWNS